jgi:NAD(P)-dependent dehydrogenase (short-subunit alcohol dehydrogenase family)
MAFAELAGKVAIITGAGSGIGLATARALAREKARLVLSDISADALEAARAELAVEGVDVTVQVTDVSRAGDVAALVEATVATYGRIDILVNNAGISQTGMKPVCEVEEDQFDAIIGVNLKGVWLGMKYAIPHMTRSGGGAIVNMSSSAGLVGQAGIAIYAASKHGVIGLTKAASMEYGMQGVRINAVCPGAVESPIRAQRRAQYSEAEWTERSRAYHPSTGRDGLPEEIASVVLFLCSDGASNIHATAIPVDGGRVAQ